MSYTIKRTTPKVKPNDPCPCNCGKKFKKCLNADPATTRPRITTVDGFDGHFWVVRDGAIIDPHFQQYDKIKRLNDLEGDAIYCPAPAEVQEEFINALKGQYTRAFGSLENFTKEARQLGWRPEANMCEKNALDEWVRNGGEIVFGSMGWKEKGSNEIWWEYGGDDWDKTEHFLKRWKTEITPHTKKQMERQMNKLMARVAKGEISLEDVLTGLN
ncbi:hypothetical protein [Dishui Lake virophage 2]|nr:hypothetical protein [Dishui Lake virophage 2]